MLSEVISNYTYNLFCELIGVKTTAQVQMEGNCDSCIMDTGSQVTTVPESFYNQNMPQHEIRAILELLEVKEANG